MHSNGWHPNGHPVPITASSVKVCLTYIAEAVGSNEKAKLEHAKVCAQYVSKGVDEFHKSAGG